MDVTLRKISELVPAEYNPRQLDKKEFADIQLSLEKFGFVDPVIVNTHPDRRNIIVGGHQRVKVAQSMGWTEVPVFHVELDAGDERELNVRLNKNSGSWDWDKLANEFDLPDLLEWGFTTDDLDAFGTDEPETDDEKPEKASKPIECPACGHTF